MYSKSLTKLGYDPDEVLRGLNARLIGERQKTPSQKTEDKKEEKKDSALRCFGRDLTELVAKGDTPGQS